jgi:glycosyltransferase involved in cell wall biosynthesis
MEFGSSNPSIGFVSTYPPTVCGLASYTASLVGAIGRHRRSPVGLGVVALADHSRRSNLQDVVFHHRVGDGSSLAKATRVLNEYDAVSIQHEFGIFGGTDGDEVIDLMSELTVPTAVTLHTVLDHPSDHQRAIVDHLSGHADRLVVMSDTASRRLIRRYGVDPDGVEVIPHGADARFAGPSLVTGERPLVLTWGLIGPGKGLEAVIEAFADLLDLDPRPRYLIAGATHPNVREAEGESYREGLVSLARRLGLQDLIEFDDRYLDRTTLARLVRSADLVVLPYASVEQVTSGVLVEAIAAAKPVIATRFPHAVELLSAGAGVTVPHGDVAALSAALRRVLTDGGLRSRMGREAQRLADGWYWPTIGRRFGAMMTTLTRKKATGRMVGSRAIPEVRSALG